MADPKITFPGLLYPLSMMRRARGLPSLEFKKIESHELPQPYRQLLDHEGDMTSRLENAYRSSIRVKRLRSSNDGKNYFREVILETTDSSPGLLSMVRSRFSYPNYRNWPSKPLFRARSLWEEF